ncbi:TPA: chromosome segregation protein SMC [Bacillus toyonensis]|nr:chromosome segregation protein SMC [Bacillus toyonensis]
MTENEKKLLELMYEMVSDMEKRVDKIEGSLDKVDDLKSVNKGIQATFEQGFADVHKGLAEIKEINKNRKTAKEIVEGIAGNGQKKSGKQVH